MEAAAQHVWITADGGGASYLHERQHKRELRLESAKGAPRLRKTRRRIWNARCCSHYVWRLCRRCRERRFWRSQGKSDLLRQSSGSEPGTIQGRKYRANGLDRLELQRIQYLADLQTADVNLRTAKIQLLALLNEQTPLDQFDVAGPYEFAEQLASPDEYRRFAMESRPDLKAALRGIDKAETDHRLAMANGSTDPTIGFDVGRNPPIDQYIGFNVSVPLRIFDRTREKAAHTD